jgi:hypothetical protein
VVWCAVQAKQSVEMKETLAWPDTVAREKAKGFHSRGGGQGIKQGTDTHSIASQFTHQLAGGWEKPWVQGRQSCCRVWRSTSRGGRQDRRRLARPVVWTKYIAHHGQTWSLQLSNRTGVQ